MDIRIKIPNTAASVRGPSPTGPAEPCRVVFLDDDAVMRRALARYAAALGIEIVAVATPVELCAELASSGGAVDAVVCDFNLGPNGETSEPVVRRLQDAGIPVVVLTGDTPSAVNALGFSVAIVAKPDLSALFDEVRRQIRERRFHQPRGA